MSKRAPGVFALRRHRTAFRHYVSQELLYDLFHRSTSMQTLLCALPERSIRPMHPLVINFSVSGAGVLIYQAGDAVVQQLTWFDRHGRVLSAMGDPGNIFTIEFLPTIKKWRFPWTRTCGSTMWHLGFARVLHSLRELTQIRSGPLMDKVLCFAPTAMVVMQSTESPRTFRERSRAFMQMESLVSPRQLVARWEVLTVASTRPRK